MSDGNSYCLPMLLPSPTRLETTPAFAQERIKLDIFYAEKFTGDPCSDQSTDSLSSVRNHAAAHPGITSWPLVFLNARRPGNIQADVLNRHRAEAVYNGSNNVGIIPQGGGSEAQGLTIVMQGKGDQIFFAA